MKKFISNIFWRLLFVALPIFLIGWIALLIWIAPVFGTMDAKHANAARLSYWFLLRDLEDVRQENRLPLMECYLREFGSESGKKPHFEMSEFVKRQVQKFEYARRDRVQQELAIAKEPEKLLAIPVPLPERNIYFLAKIWYFEKMKQYENADFGEKRKILSQMADEIKWWQEYNNEYFSAAEIPPPSVVESLQDLEMIFARWSAEASPEDRKRINAFKPRLLAVLINNGVKEMVGGNAAENVTQSVTNAVGNFFGFGKQKKEKEETKE